LVHTQNLDMEVTMMGEQIGMEFIYIYPVEEMGNLISPETISLSESFLRDKLRVSPHDVSPSYLSEEKKLTKVGCPFCKEGALKLMKIEPEYSGGMREAPAVKHRVGNRYEYGCSNPACNAEFFGTYTWRLID